MKRAIFLAMVVLAACSLVVAQNKPKTTQSKSKSKSTKKTTKKAPPKKTPPKGAPAPKPTPAPPKPKEPEKQPEPPKEPEVMVSFEKDVAPVMQRSCVGCHNSQRPAGGVDLTGTRVSQIVTAKDSAASSLIKVITMTDARFRMPKKAPALDQATIDMLKKWVDQGAKTDN